MKEKAEKKAAAKAEEKTRELEGGKATDGGKAKKARKSKAENTAHEAQKSAHNGVTFDTSKLSTAQSLGLTT